MLGLEEEEEEEGKVRKPKNEKRPFSSFGIEI